MGILRSEIRDNGLAVVILDDPDRPVNTLSSSVLDEIETDLMPLLDDPAVRAMVLASAKESTFIAGADLDLLPQMSEEEAAALSRRGNALLCQVERCPKPVVAAVHGAALGGGLEVVLACDYILASDHPSTVLALPEVMLGLLPGGGGTQRLVRRVGLATALPLMLTGSRLRARRAYRIGLVDALTTPGGIADTAERAALQLAEGRLTRRRPRRTLLDRLAGLPPVRQLILRAARKQVQRRTRGLYPAPAAIIDCVATGLARGIDAGLAAESRHFGSLVRSPQSRSLVWVFHAKGQLEKQPEGAEPRPVRRLAVLGAGLMGSGIASVSLGLCPVVLRDIADKSLSQAGRTVHSGLAKQIRSGAISRNEAERRWSRLHLTNQVDDITCADLVVEAVDENLELKRRVVAETEARVAPEAVIASNTSALPIADIAAKARHPERILGMHYFSPVPKMPLLEIVTAPATAAWAVDTARAFGIRQGKTCIVVKDGPGFYTTRILSPYLNEAILLLQEGGRIGEIDRALLDFGYPVGPLALIDEVGIDVGAHVAEDLGKAFADRGHRSSDALPRLVTAGYRGRKNGHGFYTYPPLGGRGKKRKKQPNEAIYGHLGGGQHRSPPVAEIQNRLALLTVNEAVHCLQEEVIATPRDGDIGAIFGLGFPPHAGGPFHYLDTTGPATVVKRLQELAERHGSRFAPAPLLVDMAGSKRLFYPQA